MARALMVVLIAFIAFSAPETALAAGGEPPRAGPSQDSGAQLPASELTGKVVDPTGAPVVNANVQVTPFGEEAGLKTTVTDERGWFRMSGLDADRYLIVVTAQRWAPVEIAVTVPLHPAGPLEIRVRALVLTDEVTVSTTSNARDVLRVPGEVTVVGRAAFDNAQARSLDDVLRYQPGVEMGATRRLLAAPSIRGFDASRVLVVRDGARVSQFTSAHKGSVFLDVNDVERIEVVRGPASALYGSGAMGGVLSITSPDPADLLETGRSVGGVINSSYSSAYGELMFNPRAYGSTAAGLGFVLGYTGRRNDGLVDVASDAGQVDFAEEDINAFDARLVAPVGPDGSLRVSVNTWGQRGRSSTNLASEVIGPDEQVQRSTGQETFTVSYEGRGSAWWRESLRATGYYNRMDLDEKRPSDGRADRIEFQTWGLDARNTVAWGSEQQLTYGAEFFRDVENSSRDGAGNGLFPSGRQTHFGLYAQDEVALAGGRLILVSGVRWDRWNSSGGGDEMADRADNRINPKAGATFELVEGLVASANYAEGFRAPNFQELFVSGTHFSVPLGPGSRLLGVFSPNPDLDPEVSRNVDVGLRFRRRGFSGGLAYYHSWVDGFIDTEVTRGFVPPGTVLLTFTNRNVHEATLRGLEASLRWDANVNWSARVSYSDPRGEDAVTGEPLGSIPPAKATLGVEYREPSVGALLGANVRTTADNDRVPTDIDPESGYTLVDVYTAWTPGFLPEVTLRFNIDNVADRAYRVPLLGTPGTGRDYRVGVSWNLSR